MSSFTTPLFYKLLPGQRRSGRPLFMITAVFRYALGTDGSGVEIVVPHGFVTDFASFPHWLVRLGLKPHSRRYQKAALCHDVLLENPDQIARLQRAVFIDKRCALNVLGLNVGRVLNRPIRSRLFADLVFWEMMSVCKVNPVLKAFMFFGVRLGALSAWVEGRFLKGCGYV